MTKAKDGAVSAKSTARNNILRTLWFLNQEGETPTASALARAVDPRDRVPRTTVQARRAMIGEMREAGYIHKLAVTGQGYDQLQISERGIEYVKSLKD